MPHTSSCLPMRRASVGVLFAIAAFAAGFAAPGIAGAGEIRLGILPDADSLPFIVAEDEGLFAAEGVEVRLVRFQNPVERDAAFQAGAVDGIIGDIIAAVLARQAGFDVRITSLTDGRYGIVSGGGGTVRSLADLADRPVGLSTNTIIHYMVDTFLRGAGIPDRRISVVAIPRMPVRMEMALGGQVAAAGLPEPLLTVALARGGRLLASTDDSGMRAGVLVFSGLVIDTRRADLAAMYRAYWKAAAAVNADAERYRSMLATKLGFPGESIASYRFVRYEKPRLPAEADIGNVVEWMKFRGLVTKPLDLRLIMDAKPLSGW